MSCGAFERGSPSPVPVMGEGDPRSNLICRACLSRGRVKRRPDGFSGAASGGPVQGGCVGVRVGTRRRGQTDMRGLVTRRTGCSAGALLLSIDRAWRGPVRAWCCSWFDRRSLLARPPPHRLVRGAVGVGWWVGTDRPIADSRWAVPGVVEGGVPRRRRSAGAPPVSTSFMLAALRVLHVDTSPGTGRDRRDRGTPPPPPWHRPSEDPSPTTTPPHSPRTRGCGGGRARSDLRTNHEQHQALTGPCHARSIDSRNAPAEQPVLRVTNPRISV